MKFDIVVKHIFKRNSFQTSQDRIYFRQRM